MAWYYRFVIASSLALCFPIGSFALGWIFDPPPLKFVPSGDLANKRPLLVALHGCDQSAQEFAEGTRLSELAESEKFFVLYPQQWRSINPVQCWNWFRQDNQRRNNRGESARIIQDIEEFIAKNPQVDRERIFVTGISAGAAMANALISCYPDYFRGAALVAGVAFAAAQDGVTAGKVMKGTRPLRPEENALSAFACASDSRKLIPVLIFHGRADTIVYPENADWIERQMQVLADLRDDALENGSVKLEIRDGCQGTIDETCTRDTYLDGQLLVRKVLIREVGHAWTGSPSRHRYHDRRGPDASREMWAFFQGISL